MPRLYNRKRHHPKGAVYIARGSKWGNDYSHLDGTKATHKVGSRAEAISCYIKEKSADPEFIAQVKSELKGKDLVCYCEPLACHGDWLLEVANEE